MKGSLTYLFRIILLAGLLFGSGRLAVSQDAAGRMAGDEAIVGDTGYLFEKDGTPHSIELPDHMLLPKSETPGTISLKNQISKRNTGFFSLRRYLTQKTFRDYREDYRILLEKQNELPPILEPALEYVFLLRQIVI